MILQEILSFNSVTNFSPLCLRRIPGFRPPYYEADDDINTKNSLDNSGSNETMQKVLASIVKLWQSFKKNLGSQKFQKFKLLCFSSVLVEGNIG